VVRDPNGDSEPFERDRDVLRITDP